MGIGDTAMSRFRGQLRSAFVVYMTACFVSSDTIFVLMKCTVSVALSHFSIVVKSTYCAPRNETFFFFLLIFIPLDGSFIGLFRIFLMCDSFRS